MELLTRRCTLLTILIIITTQLSMTQNIDSNWSQLYKKQKIIEEIASTSGSGVASETDRDAGISNKNIVNNNKLELLKSETKEGSPNVEGSTSSNDDKSNEPHSRKKRLIWITEDGRLALPPGTSLTISPTLALPFVRYPPDGFFSNISISLPVTSNNISSMCHF